MPNHSNLTAARDEQLIAATLQGETSSFGIIVRRYWKMAIALTISKINDPIAAEDVAQESFLKAYSQLHKLRDPSIFAGWLSKIVARECVNHIRKSTQNKIISSWDSSNLEAIIPALALNDNPGLSKQQVHFVRRCVCQLPDKFKKVIIMRFVGGLSARQIAHQLNKHHGTVRVQLHRAYQILRKELSPLLDEVEI